MDPLSDWLSLLKPRSYVTGGVALAENMAIQWPQHEGIKCYAVVSGQCWLTVSGILEPLLLTPGDCYILPPGPPFCLATSLTASPIDFRVLRDEGILGREVAKSGDEPCFMVGGHFVLTGNHAALLLGSLPPVVHIQNESDKAAIRWSLDRISQEVRFPQPGSSLITQQLAYTMLIQALRLHLAGNPSAGWLFALADKQLSAALTCIHDEPGFDWTLDKLASRIGMSRSSFALRFKEMAGTSPIEYLTRWRMLLACDRLENSNDSLTVIATRLGYESESAFGKAFKRVIGCSPRQHGRRMLPNASTAKAL
ncbi:AraC family transcriptional regulator [Rouxiella silvae]|uniref:AraC family transcriptional regulator n=1 Tax=Rouxiella silvae TaxID=1646373 RepID=A0AA41BX71_9GAMM|nr:AraC family transcriptional regulator [Rouxiella silvae]MBF6637634.1 AraC family transcriptional regulator [Rouxiella silvae]